MLIDGATMLSYAHTKNCCYYAQNYASIVCQTLVWMWGNTVFTSVFREILGVQEDGDFLPPATRDGHH